MTTAESFSFTQRDVTAFVREVVLPGIGCAAPTINGRACAFKLDVGSSEIHRWGVFAIEHIPADSFVIEYTGEKIDAKELTRRSFREHLYIFTLNDDYSIDGAIGGSGAEYINHSCAPNLKAIIDGDRIFFVSIRDISPSEELTLDYRLDDEFPLPCYCGAKGCRGFIR